MSNNKDYNVDDILSEIKQRKMQQRSKPSPQHTPVVPPDTPDELSFKAPETFSFSNEPEVLDTPRNVPPPEPIFTHPPDQGSFDIDFDTLVDDVKTEPRGKVNPLDFTAPVQPIANRGRRQKRKLEATQNIPRPTEQTGGFDFKPPAEQPQGDEVSQQTSVIDFSAFRSEAPKDVQEDTAQHTRVIPPPDQQENAPPRFDIEDSYYEDDYYFDSAPEQSIIDYSEYNSLDDRHDVATDIARVKLWLFVRSAATLLLTFAVCWLAMAGRYVMPIPSAIEPVPETMRAYMITCTLITALIGIVNSSAVGGGLISLFKMRANSDSLATLALLAAVGQGVVGIFSSDTINPVDLNLYFPIAALAMLFGTFGKLSMISRIQTNFRLIASDRPKKALLTVEDDSFCRGVLPEATHRPTICYAAPADFFTDFLGLSYSDKYDVGIYRSVAPVSFLGAVVVGVVSYLLTQDTASAVASLTAILCIAATFSATFVENIPLGKLTKKLSLVGGMVSGNKAVENFCDTSAVIFTDNDLFPKGNTRLRGIKSFSQGRIDQAIIDAASVLCSLEGALAPVFLQMIGDNRSLLRPVDNVVYENGMGVSAWVDSRRVLIGNRQLMLNHGITIPPEAQQQDYSSAPEDGELIYLSSAGDLSAQFAIGYHIDEEFAAQLDKLAEREITLIIYTTDANITPQRIWELYGYPEELIQILPAERHTQYRNMASKRDEAIAEIVYTGRASTMAASITACVNARSSILSATVIQLIQIVLGYGLVAFMAFMGATSSLTILQLAIYQIFWFLAVFLVQKTKQS